MEAVEGFLRKKSDQDLDLESHDEEMAVANRDTIMVIARREVVRFLLVLLWYQFPTFQGHVEHVSS